jgi:hypothetical protein
LARYGNLENYACLGAERNLLELEEEHSWKVLKRRI